MNETKTNYTQKVYSVRDSKSEVFFKPFISKNAGEALRSFASEANRGDGLISQYPEDFALYELGDWDERAGKLMPYLQNKMLGHAFEFKQGSEDGRTDIERAREDRAN